MKAMILAAGLGTRLKPFTDHHPKALARVNGKSLLQRNVAYLLSQGYNDIIVNVHHFAEQIIEAIKTNNGWGANITISDESNEVLETGGGLKKAAPFFSGDDEPFVLLNADILTDTDLKAMRIVHEEQHALATLAVRDRETSRYLMFDNNKLCGWFHEKTGEQKGFPGEKKAFSGLHIISPKLLSLISEEGKFSMIDVYLRLCATENIVAFDDNDSKFIDVGKPESIEKAERIFV